jgi:hypothetical protein
MYRASDVSLFNVLQYLVLQSSLSDKTVAHSSRAMPAVCESDTGRLHASVRHEQLDVAATTTANAD